MCWRRRRCWCGSIRARVTEVTDAQGNQTARQCRSTGVKRWGRRRIGLRYIRGGTDAPALNRAVAWRYARKNGLKSAEVPAVGEFKKAVDEAVKQQQQKQKQQGQSAPAASKP